MRRRRTRGLGRRRRGQPADVARLRRDAELEELHHPEGVVHHDADVEGRAIPAVALGSMSGVRVPREPMRWTEPTRRRGGGGRLCCVLRQGDGTRQCAIGSRRRGGSGGEVGRMVVAGEREEAVDAEKRARYLTTPPPRTDKCRALRSRRVVKSSELKSTRSCSTGDSINTSNNAQLNLRWLEQNSSFWPKTTSKTSWKDFQKYSPFRRDHVGDGVDEQVER